MRKILYFIAEPTDEQLAFAKTHQMRVRNPRAYSPSDYLEPCDAVYGDAPQAYLDKFPLFELPNEKEQAKAVKQTKGAKNDPKHSE